MLQFFFFVVVFFRWYDSDRHERGVPECEGIQGQTGASHEGVGRQRLLDMDGDQTHRQLLWYKEGTTLHLPSQVQRLHRFHFSSAVVLNCTVKHGRSPI